MSKMTEKDTIDLVENENIYRINRIKKLDQWKSLGINPYPYKFDKTNDAQELQIKYQSLETGAETNDQVSVAGRIMAYRNNGMFIDLQDASGKIQIFSHKANMEADNLEQLKLLDIGDIIGVVGIIRRTPRGELTINAQKVTLLSKSLLTLPEKYHGLTDKELRYRQRYLDLIMNESTRIALRNRSKIIAAMRDFLIQKGFLEVETPMLHSIVGGAAALPFVTHHNTLDMDLFLRIAPRALFKKTYRRWFIRKNL